MMADIRDIEEVGIDHAIAEAKRGHFDILADQLKSANVHSKIVQWVREGCRTDRRQGRPTRNPRLERKVCAAYLHYREMIPPEDLAEKALILSLVERYRLDEREVRRIVAADRRQSIAQGAEKYGISPHEAAARWDENRKRRWQRWREMKAEGDIDVDEGE